jgi:hypothetical protein
MRTIDGRSFTSIAARIAFPKKETAETTQDGLASPVLSALAPTTEPLSQSETPQQN